MKTPQATTVTTESLNTGNDNENDTIIIDYYKNQREKIIQAVLSFKNDDDNDDGMCDCSVDDVRNSIEQLFTPYNNNNNDTPISIETILYHNLIIAKNNNTNSTTNKNSDNGIANNKCTDVITPMIVACDRGNVAAVQYFSMLYNNGSVHHAANTNIHNDRIRQSRLLYRAMNIGFPIDCCGESLNTSFHHAAMIQSSSNDRNDDSVDSILHYLMRIGGDSMSDDNHCQCNDDEIIDPTDKKEISALQIGLLRNANGDTPIHMACAVGNIHFLSTWYAMAQSDMNNNNDNHNDATSTATTYNAKDVDDNSNSKKQHRRTQQIQDIFQASNQSGDTCITLSCCDGHENIVDYLLDLVSSNVFNISYEEVNKCRVQMNQIDASLNRLVLDNRKKECNGVDDLSNSTNTTTTTEVFCRHYRVKRDAVKRCLQKVELKLQEQAEQIADQMLISLMAEEEGDQQQRQRKDKTSNSTRTNQKKKKTNNNCKRKTQQNNSIIKQQQQSALSATESSLVGALPVDQWSDKSDSIIKQFNVVDNYSRTCSRNSSSKDPKLRLTKLNDGTVAVIVQGETDPMEARSPTATIGTCQSNYSTTRKDTRGNSDNSNSQHQSHCKGNKITSSNAEKNLQQQKLKYQCESSPDSFANYEKGCSFASINNAIGITEDDALKQKQHCVPTQPQNQQLQQLPQLDDTSNTELERRGITNEMPIDLDEIASPVVFDNQNSTVEEGTKQDGDGKVPSSPTTASIRPCSTWAAVAMQKRMNNDALVGSTNRSMLQDCRQNANTICIQPKPQQPLPVRQTPPIVPASSHGNDHEIVMKALCLDVSMLLYTAHGMSLNLSPCQLDAIEQILTEQLQSVQQARIIQGRVHHLAPPSTNLQNI